MKTTEAQGFIAARLAAASYFAGVPIMRQLAPDATPDQIAAEEQTFERHLAEKGLVLVVLRRTIGAIAGVESSVALDAMVPVAICENPEVNRRAAGLQKPSDDAIDQAVAAVMGPLVRFGQAAVVDPMKFDDGLYVSYVQPLVRCVVRVPPPVFVPPSP